MTMSKLQRAGVTRYNVPRRTRGHRLKSHVVVAKSGNKTKIIRFGQQGVVGDKSSTKRSRAFKKRHAKNIAKGPMYPAYWSNKVKW